MVISDYGYLDNPANGLGIVRARTLLGNLRSWDIPRTEEALKVVTTEIGGETIPALYMLFDERSEKKIYIGQTENLQNRMQSHLKSPKEDIKNWGRAIIINDGRNAKQSDLNDENIQLILEDYLVNLFKINRYTVHTDATRVPSLSATQTTLANSFKEEIIILLTRKNKITKVLQEKGDDEVYNDEVKKVLERKGYKVNEWGKVNATINDKKAFLRPGSPKSKGWQITFRGAKDESFKTSLKKGDGYLIIPRGPIIVIPLKNIKELVEKTDIEAFKRDTIDIFFKFEKDKITAIYKESELDISSFKLKN